MACPLATERVWTDKVQYHAAEKQYHEYLSKLHNNGIKNDTNLENEIAITPTTSSTATNEENEAFRSKSPLKKISKNQRKRQGQQRGPIDDDANQEIIPDCDVKMDAAKKNNKKQQRNMAQTNECLKQKDKPNGKNKPKNLPHQSSIEDESITESIAHEPIKSPMKKPRNNNKNKANVQQQSSSDEKNLNELAETGPPHQKSQTKNPHNKRIQQRANNDSMSDKNDSPDQQQQKSQTPKKDGKSKQAGNETDSMKRQKNKQNAKKNPIWSDDEQHNNVPQSKRNLPITTEEACGELQKSPVKKVHGSAGFEKEGATGDNKTDSFSEQFIEVPIKRKRSRRAKKDKQQATVTPFTFVATGTNDCKNNNSSRSESISSIDVQSVDIVIAEEIAADKSKDVKELENIVNQKKASENLALKENNDNRIYDTVVNVVDNILKEQVKNRGAGPSSLASEIAKARQHIKNSLERMDGIAALASTPSAELLDRLSSVEKQNAQLQSTVNNLQDIVDQLQEKIKALELGGAKPTVQTASTSSQVTKSPVVAAPAAKSNEDDDDGVDLFGSDSEDEDEAAAKLREQRLSEYAAKKSKKPALIAKSNIILDIKPWSDETDMKEMEQEVRKITMDGLLWGAAKLVPLAYGIHKLQISTVVEDEKVSIDALQEEIQNIEELVQSVDIAAFNKI